ncbi:sigma 54-interacting transcriptional regulator [Jannaschia sp. CCS1]|uniref:sigma 54-interacting transcriptional regulator n=1 Tax=Jannaschia sp. (strain CCS1) TaxID=290400 RepID=UPI000053A1BF|nr:sigma 54-interacting transcriptional regulator [Jannaschia sp. CCS1]ABD55994.1 sigma-54 factor protein [Jannaschia sp. CCS1]
MQVWAEHPLFSVETPHEAARRLDLFEDGVIALSLHGDVVSANREALRMLDLQGASVEGRSLMDLPVAIDGWADVVDFARRDRRADVALRGAGGCPIVATLKRVQPDGPVQWIQLRDVEVFEFRRDKVFGRKAEDSVRFLSDERTRPDFAEQRRLSPEMNRVLSRGERAIRMGARTLITGESGVGKSEIARFLAASVADSRDPFVIVNCAASSPDDFDRMLFGGDGTKGLIAQAEGGTLFLDEVGDVPLSSQARLLGLLEDGQRTQGGSANGRPRHIRVISATNRDLRKMMRTGDFRADLYFRLAVIHLHVPPLREMTRLVDHLIDRFARTIDQRRQAPMQVPQRLREILADYAFPGNIRELLNIVQRLAIDLEDAEELDDLIGSLIAPSDIAGPHDGIAPATTATLDLRAEVRQFERGLIDRAIQIHGSKRKAAKALGVDIGTIVRKTATPTNEDQ